jgi:hypothetical protein
MLFTFYVQLKNICMNKKDFKSYANEAPWDNFETNQEVRVSKKKIQFFVN